LTDGKVYRADSALVPSRQISESERSGQAQSPQLRGCGQPPDRDPGGTIKKRHTCRKSPPTKAEGRSLRSSSTSRVR